MADDLAPGAITDVLGIRVGHATHEEALTGCTVVLCGEGMVAGVSVRGLAPGTRETDLLRPATLVEQVHAIVLTGGSAYGLAAADGVMRCLEARGIGYKTGQTRVPIVPAAVLYDLGIGACDVRPDAAMGERACEDADDGPVAQGNVGAGAGATVGKILGMSRAMKAGLGTASVRAGRLVVGALIAVNAFGDVVDPETGAIIAGARKAIGRGFADTRQAMRGMLIRNVLAHTNTVIGVVATNARLNVAQANEVAAAAHDGLARAVRPSHTLFDGDTLFALAGDELEAHQTLVMDMAAEAVALAIVNGVRAARAAGGLPAAGDLSA
ncbi:MAG: P1 family peptidase [Chloroflexi bacterium]|nr:P1 family peptidase [Chloroflexota bacterium]